MSIQRLSNPNEDPIFDKRLLYYNMRQNTAHNLIAFNQVSNNQPNDWQEQVQKRIDAKTKIKKVIHFFFNDFVLIFIIIVFYY